MTHSPAIGSRIAGRYVVRGTLGEGGMGQVFEVENEAVDRRFALKVLRIDPLTDSALGRFRREAKAVGRLQSSRVVQVIDSGIDETVGPYMVMELLFGETLDRKLARDFRLPWQEAAHLAASLCDALADVHAAGLVHRDLKPSNVGLPAEGPIEVKLLDFGLAASLVEGAFTEKLTQSQQLIGTLPYMAPEQFHNAPVTSAVDLYAVGIMLFELLAGRRPFVATSVAAYVQMHLFEPPPTIAEVAPDVQVPSWLDSLILQLLSKEVHDRPESASEVAEILRRNGAQEHDRAERPTARAWVGSRDIPSNPKQPPAATSPVSPPPSTAILLRTPKVVVRPPPLGEMTDTVSDLHPAGLVPWWRRILWPTLALALALASVIAWQMRGANPNPNPNPNPAPTLMPNPTPTPSPTPTPNPNPNPNPTPSPTPNPTPNPSASPSPTTKPARVRPEKRATVPPPPKAGAGESKSTWKGEVITDTE